MGKPDKITLGDLINFQRGYDLPKSQFVDGNVPVVSSNGILGYHNIAKVKAPGITIGRSGTVGYPHYITQDFFPHNTSLYVENFKENDTQYIYYLLKSLGLNEHKSGSGVPTMNRNHLHPLPIIAYKNTDHQKKISSILSSLDEKIELNNRINAELEAMAKTLYDYWFVQFEFPNKDGKPYKSSGGKMIYSPELKREIPDGWAVGQLGQWVSFKRGISYKSKDIQDTGIPLINLNSFQLSGQIKPQGTKFFNGNFKESAQLTHGDIVIAITDVTRNADIIGKSFIIPDIFDREPLISCDVASVIPHDDLCNYYLEMLFNSEVYHEYIKHFASGTLVLHLDLKGIEWFKTFKPNKNVLEKFKAIKEKMHRKQIENYKQNQELIKIRDFLLPMLMNGQVGIK